MLLKDFNHNSNPYWGFDPNFNFVIHSPWKFQRVYIWLKVMNDGFVNGSRPFIGNDGYHLNGLYGGVFFITVSLDASVTLDVKNALFLGIYVIGEDENRDGLCMFCMTLSKLESTINHFALRVIDKR